MIRIGNKNFRGDFFLNFFRIKTREFKLQFDIIDIIEINYYKSSKKLKKQIFNENNFKKFSWFILVFREKNKGFKVKIYFILLINFRNKMLSTSI